MLFEQAPPLPGGAFCCAPDLLVLELAIRSGTPAPDIPILLIGSMNACPPSSELLDLDIGVLDWIKGNRVFRTMIGAQAAVTARMMRGRVGDRYLRMDADPGLSSRFDVVFDRADSKAVAAAIMAAEPSLPELDKWSTRPQVRLTAEDF